MTEQLNAAINHLFGMKEMENCLGKMAAYFELDEGANDELFALLSCAVGNSSFGDWNDVRREDAIYVFTKLILMKDAISTISKAQIKSIWNMKAKNNK